MVRREVNLHPAFLSCGGFVDESFAGEDSRFESAIRGCGFISGKMCTAEGAEEDQDELLHDAVELGGFRVGRQVSRIRR